MQAALSARVNGSSIELFDGRSGEVLATIATNATLVNRSVAGVAASYRIARGVASITGSGTVVSGLTTVVSVVATLRDDADLTALCATATIGDQAGAPAAGSVIVSVWKPTGAGDATPIAASAAKSVNWVAVGT